MLMMFLEILLMLIFLFFVKYIIDMLVENVIKNLEFQVFLVICWCCNYVYNDEDYQLCLLLCLYDVCLDCLCEFVFDEFLICLECKMIYKILDNDVIIFFKDLVKLGWVL